MALKGRITVYLTNRYIGFLLDEGLREYFFHLKDVISGTPCKGALVEFELNEGNLRPETGRLAAHNIVVAQ